MDLVKRAQGIILKPQDEWAKIKGEPTTVTQLFTQYAVILAVIPAVAKFLGWVLLGIRVPYSGASLVGSVLLRAILGYIFGLVEVYIVGFVINALAPNFASTQSLPQAMKLVVYSMTPYWIAGIFYIIPGLGPLVVLAGIYSLYILFLGFNHPLIGTPKEKVVLYLIVVAAVIIIIEAVIGILFFMRGVISVF